MAPHATTADSPAESNTPPPLGLTKDQISSFWRDGFLILPSYLSPQQCTSLLSTTSTLLHDFPLDSHPMTKFTTGHSDTDTDAHVGDDYFLTSGDKVRFFFEPDAFTDGTLSKPKHLAINKIGHSLHTLIPEFGEISHRGDIGKRNAAIAKDLGCKDPRLLQSMVICKQPEIGGEVGSHMDSTFLYTKRPSAVGFWIALEDATRENGCLSFARGSHRRTPVAERFVRKADDSGTTFDKIEGEEGRWPRHFEHQEADEVREETYELGEVKAGTLVLIHGNVLHRSEKNTSQKGRMIYTFHVIEGEEEYDGRNWLQIPGGPETFTKLNGSEV
jgi:phytanoyl-CoA hydroxylase